MAEAKRFDRTMTHHFGLLSYDCNNEHEFIEAVEQVLWGCKQAEAWKLAGKKYFEF